MENSLKLFPHIRMAIYLFSQILKFTKYSIKFIEKLSRRHLINFSDVFVMKGFIVLYSRLVYSILDLSYLFKTCLLNSRQLTFLF